MIKYTESQEKVLNTVYSDESNNKIIFVRGVEGSGKTMLAADILKIFSGKNYLYITPNKNNVQNLKSMGLNGRIETVYSYARYIYKTINNDANINLKTNFSIKAITDKVDFNIKNYVVKILNNFFKSSYKNLNDFISSSTEYKQAVLENYEIYELATQYYKKIEDNDLISYDYLLKYLHEKMLNKEVEIKCDIIILDDYQNVSDTFIEIFKLIKSEKKIVFGDRLQSIFRFAKKSQDKFNLLNNLITIDLNESFRCNKNMADEISRYAKKYLDKNFQMVSKIENDRCETKFNNAYITRYNSTILEYIYNFMESGKNFTLIKPFYEISGLASAIYSIKNRIKEIDYKFMYLQKYYYKYLLNSGYDSYYSILEDTFSYNYEIINTISFLKSLEAKGENYFDFKNRVKKFLKNDAEDRNVKETVIATAHSFTGCDADNVYICDDLKESSTKAVVTYLNCYKDTVVPDKILDEMMLYYTAISRAHREVINRIGL